MPLAEPTSQQPAPGAKPDTSSFVRHQPILMKHSLASKAELPCLKKAMVPKAEPASNKRSLVPKAEPAPKKKALAPKRKSRAKKQKKE